MNEKGNIDKYNLLHSDGNLWKSATISAMKLAMDIKNESPSTEHHQERLQWAYQVLANPDQWVTDNKWQIISATATVSAKVGEMMVAVEGETQPVATLSHESTDDDIDLTVAALVPGQ